MIIIFTIVTSLGITKINFTENLNNKILQDLQNDANVITKQIEKNLSTIFLKQKLNSEVPILEKIKKVFKI